MKNHVIACCLCILLTQSATADEWIARDVVGSGGGAAVTANFQLLHTIGQSVINLTTDPDYTHEQGFWYSPWFFVTGVEEEFPTPLANRLDQNFPNPFNPVTTIRFALRTPSRVTLKIYDILGRLVTTLVDEEKAAGEYTILFHASSLKSGVYFYCLRAAEFDKTRKMVILR